MYVAITCDITLSPNPSFQDKNKRKRRKKRKEIAKKLKNK